MVLSFFFAIVESSHFACPFYIKINYSWTGILRVEKCALNWDKEDNENENDDEDNVSPKHSGYLSYELKTKNK